jgi:hypothetical protein
MWPAARFASRLGQSAIGFFQVAADSNRAIVELGHHRSWGKGGQKIEDRRCGTDRFVHRTLPTCQFSKRYFLHAPADSFEINSVSRDNWSIWYAAGNFDSDFPAKQL